VRKMSWHRGAGAPTQTTTFSSRADSGDLMTDRIRILKHEVVPDCGSFEVRFPHDRPSVWFYWDDLPGRRLNPATLDRETALEQAKAVARAAETR
jgi:hypothetical protein